MNELSDREFGDYHIIRRIGSGATADVFLAEQRSLGRRVALKILKKELASDETYLRRFVREARAIAALNHPSLVQIYQIDSLDGYWFIAQEYVQGETLQQEIQRLGALSIPQVVDILWKIAAAFESAAESGIVHRAIKPENILLGSNGIVKVTDFGLAHVKISDMDHSHLAITEVGMTLGTPLYMSPEQAQGHVLDHRSDIYSLGITCWHALTGKPPFTGDTALSVALQHVNNPPPPLTKLRSDIPSALAAVIERMIDKKPERRFQTFRSILQELQMKGVVLDTRSLLTPKSGSAALSARQMLQRALEQRRTYLGRIASILIFAVMIALLGWSGGYSYRTWIKPPFLEANTQSVPKKTTVEEQWVYACFLDTLDTPDTPDAWQSVIDHFPDEEYFWGNKVKRQLIRYYYSKDNREKSLPLFQEFAELSDIDLQERMLGLAGLAWCTANQGDERIPWSYMNQIMLAGVPNSDDELFIQIFDAANEILKQKKKEPPAGDAVP
jgi:serine/threonine-protein kinase